MKRIAIGTLAVFSALAIASSASAAPVSLGTASHNSESVIQPELQRTGYGDKVYHKDEVILPKIYYSDSEGYAGWIYLTRIETSGDYVFAYYSGPVYKPL